MAKKVSHKIFNSKILLFGEQIINKGAMGLALPVERYSGVLKFGELTDKRIRESNKLLESFANYIIYHNELASQYDCNRFLEDLEEGLYFDSDIPQGYGLGSSGALVASVYNQYQKFKKKNSPVSVVKNELALLESYFHGKSSGLDALVSYFNKGVIVTNGEVTETFDFPNESDPGMKIFLLNTHRARNTSTYVNLFLEKCKDKKFMTLVNSSLIPANNIAVDSFMTKKYAVLTSSLKLISQLQYDMLPEFIPKEFRNFWKEGLRTDEYQLKICGAGGGGFIIGFAKADTKPDLLLQGKDIIELMKF